MPSFHNGAVEIAYLDEGEGDPIVLVHGFASTKNVNWVYPTWVSELKKSGRRVIALDNRGHGDSAKLYDPEAYHIGTMAGDVGALMDHLNIERAGITVPVLIAVGTKDEIAGSAQALGRIIPGSKVLDIPNRDHMRAVGDKVYKKGVLDFLSQRT